MPTSDQALGCARVCQMLSSGYQPINLFRYNPDNEVVYILAGVNDGIEVLVFPDGLWRFINSEA
jgi:hypothetical protein